MPQARWNLQAAYNGTIDRREKLLAAKAAVEKRGVDGELSSVGVDREKKRFER